MEKGKFDDVYGGKPPFQASSETSEAAAEQIADTALTKRAEVMAFISAQGERGATDQEIQRGLGMTVSTQVPRRRALVLKGLVRDAGFCRRNVSGNMATVWVAAHGQAVEYRGPFQTLRQKYRAALESNELLRRELVACKAENRRLRSRGRDKRQLGLFDYSDGDQTDGR